MAILCLSDLPMIGSALTQERVKVLPMLTIYRRHIKTCSHRSEGRKYRRCHCPIWVDGFLDGQQIRKALRDPDRHNSVRDWQKAQDTVREWEADNKIT